MIYTVLKTYNNTTMDPPQCVQNAMMTKDKKPFTYTPGGIDLSEVKSPRMQRRIERNAHLGGAGDMPQPPHPPQHVGPLPPSALAAMRPQTQVGYFIGSLKVFSYVCFRFKCFLVHHHLHP